MKTPSLFNLFILSVHVFLVPVLSFIELSKARVLSSTLFKNLLVTLLGALANPTTKQ
jgi:hypothetical protein